MILFLGLALLSGCQNVQKPSPLPVTGDAARWIAEKALQRSATYPFKKISVINFTDNRGNPTSFGKFLADRIRSYLDQSRAVQVIGHVDERNQEKWSEPGDPNQPGYTLKTDVVLEGTITSMQGFNDIYARLYDGKDSMQIEEYRVRESIEDFKLDQKLDQETPKPAPKLNQPID